MTEQPKRLTLDEFIAEQQRRLAGFRSYWMEQHHADPEATPIALWAGDWAGQLDMFLAGDL